MKEIIALGSDLLINDGDIALESMTFEMGPSDGAKIPATSKPLNITTDAGIHHATIYACFCTDDTIPSQQVCTWLAGLKETDQVELTILSISNNLPLTMMINLFTALTSTKAKLAIHLDHIVCDNLAYFYLIPERIIKGSEGALFIPSYALQRPEDMSGPARVILDFFKWVTDEAVEKNILTADEASTLQRGSHVVVPNDRF